MSAHGAGRPPERLHRALEDAAEAVLGQAADEARRTTRSARARRCCSAATSRRTSSTSATSARRRAGTTPPTRRCRSVNDAVLRARDLLVQGANDTLGRVRRGAIAAEIDQLIDVDQVRRQRPVRRPLRLLRLGDAHAALHAGRRRHLRRQHRRRSAARSARASRSPVNVTGRRACSATAPAAIAQGAARHLHDLRASNTAQRCRPPTSQPSTPPTTRLLTAQAIVGAAPTGSTSAHRPAAAARAGHHASSYPTSRTRTWRRP